MSLLPPLAARYANLCSDMVRAALKEPVKAKAKAREVIYFRQAIWKNGQPEKQGAGGALGGGDGSGESVRRQKCLRRLRAGRSSPRLPSSTLPVVITDTTEGLAGKLS